MNCADPHTFYFTQGFQTSTQTPFSLQSGVAFSKSTDGGATGATRSRCSKGALTHFIDKPWSALDPKHPRHIFVTYTDLDFSGSVCGTPFNPVERVAIELVRSLDGGATWGAPVVLDEVCSTPPDFPLVQGTQVLLNPAGRVFVAWEAFLPGGSRELRIAKSVDTAATFQPPVRVTDVFPTGDGSTLQGGIRNNEFPSLAVDRSSGPGSGTLYIAWNDGRLLRYPDFESPYGDYGYANVFVTKSRDGGSSWSAPVRVNDDPVATASGRGTDHFQPGVAVDNTGAVGVCWYDRRHSAINLNVSRFCATSKDAGASWANQGLPGGWLPYKSADAAVNPYYLGDYDTVVTDASAAAAGFMGAFGDVELPPGALVPNQNVYLVNF